MVQETVQYLYDHPRAFMGAVAVLVLLAGFGLWYVITHHLQTIVISALCAAGLFSAGLVILRGVQTSMNDLIAVGVFLLFVFPLIFWQAQKLSNLAPPTGRGARGQPTREVGASFRD